MPTEPKSKPDPFPLSYDPETLRPLGIIEQVGAEPATHILEGHKYVARRLEAKYERLRDRLYGPRQRQDEKKERHGE